MGFRVYNSSKLGFILQVLMGILAVNVGGGQPLTSGVLLNVKEICFTMWMCFKGFLLSHLAWS